MASSTFAYRPLESPSTIRLLKLHPESGVGAIYCEIEHFLQSDTSKPEYIALSYCWGETEETPVSRISICIRYKGDQAFHSRLIFDNLWRLLDQLRTSGVRTEFYYWMDALCLDQHAADEKAEQIPRMGTIYSEALRTISWLGLPDPKDNLQLFSKSMTSLPEWIMKNRLELDKMFGSMSVIAFKQGLGDDGRTLLLPAKDDLRGLSVEGIEPAMRAILSQPYWKRVWIIQEVALARNVEIMFGAHCLEFSNFLIAYKAWVAYMRSNSIRPAAIQARMDLPVDGISFDAIIQWGKKCESAKLLDRVYGLLGLLDQSQADGSPYSEFLKVDYNKTPEQLFWELVFGLKPDTASGIFEGLAESLIPGCILDGEGLSEIASSSASSKPHQTFVRRFMRALSIFRAIIQLFGWNNIYNFLIVEFEEEANYSWVRSWISHMPADHTDAHCSEMVEGQLAYAIQRALTCHRPGRDCREAADSLPPDWKCSRDQTENAPMSSAKTVKSIELYSHKFGPRRWQSLKRKLCAIYNSGSSGEPEFPTDSCLPPLVVDIQPVGWGLSFDPSPDLLEYLRKAEFEPGTRSKLMLGKLDFKFGRRHGFD